MSTWDFLVKLKSAFNEDFWIAQKFKTSENEFFFTHWHKMSEWKNFYPTTTPNYRSILYNELVLETDYPTPEENKVIALQVMEKLRERNAKFWCVFTGNKSYHVHTFCDSLKLVQEFQIEKAKRILALDLLGQELFDKMDGSNFRNKRLIQIEVSKNPKTGLDTSFLEEHEGQILKFDFGSVLDLEKTFKKYVLPTDDWKRTLIPKTCLALEYALVNKLPSGRITRYEYISPSLAAYIRNRANRDELAKKFYEIQEKHGDLEAWDRKPSNFSCKQIRIFMESNKLSNICEECLLGK